MQSVSFYMADGNLPIAVIAKAYAARFSYIWRRMIDKFMRRVKTAGKIQTAMPVGDENTRPDGIFFRGHDAYGSFHIRFVNYFAMLKNPVRNKRFLAHNPQHPIKRNGPFLVGSENKNFIFAAIRLLNYLKYQVLTAIVRRVMKQTFIHKETSKNPKLCVTRQRKNAHLPLM